MPVIPNGDTQLNDYDAPIFPDLEDGDHLTYYTQLVGIGKDGDPVPLANFLGYDSFEGGGLVGGGIQLGPVFNTVVDDDIGIGHGGVTLLEVNGVAVAAAEPSTWAMMLVGFAGLGYASLRRRSTARLA